MTKKRLFLHEELMLLALRDEKGTLAAGDVFQYALGGALLSELLLHKRVSVDKTKRKLVNLISSELIGEPLLDECLAKLGRAKRRASLRTWVSRLGGLKKVKHRVAQGLCRRGILREDEDTVLLVFTRKIYPEVDPKPERELVERLRKAIFTDAEDVEPRTTVLVSLAHHADLLKNVFDKKAMKGRKARIRQIIDGEMTGKAAKEIMDAMHAAVLAACVVPAIAASVTSR